MKSFQLYFIKLIKLNKIITAVDTERTACCRARGQDISDTLRCANRTWETKTNVFWSLSSVGFVIILTLTLHDGYRNIL